MSMLNPTKLDIAVYWYHFFVNKYSQTGDKRYWFKMFEAWELIAKLKGRQQCN